MKFHILVVDFHSVVGGVVVTGGKQGGDGVGVAGDHLEDWSREEGVGEEDKRGGTVPPSLPQSLPAHQVTVCWQESGPLAGPAGCSPHWKTASPHA